MEEDPRNLEFDREFDVVLSLGGGALEHFDYDEENLRAFRAAARALRPGGRLLMRCRTSSTSKGISPSAPGSRKAA